MGLRLDCGPAGVANGHGAGVGLRMGYTVVGVKACDGRGAGGGCVGASSVVTAGAAAGLRSKELEMGIGSGWGLA